MERREEPEKVRKGAEGQICSTSSVSLSVCLISLFIFPSLPLPEHTPCISWSSHLPPVQTTLPSFPHLFPSFLSQSPPIMRALALLYDVCMSCSRGKHSCVGCDETCSLPGFNPVLDTKTHSLEFNSVGNCIEHTCSVFFSFSLRRVMSLWPHSPLFLFFLCTVGRGSV